MKRGGKVEINTRNLDKKSSKNVPFQLTKSTIKTLEEDVKYVQKRAT